MLRVQHHPLTRTRKIHGTAPTVMSRFMVAIQRSRHIYVEALSWGGSRISGNVTGLPVPGRGEICVGQRKGSKCIVTLHSR